MKERASGDSSFNVATKSCLPRCTVSPANAFLCCSSEIGNPFIVTGPDSSLSIMTHESGLKYFAKLQGLTEFTQSGSSKVDGGVWCCP